MRSDRRLAERLRAFPLGKTLLSLFLMGGDILFGYVPENKTPTVSERVSLVRQALAQKKELLPLVEADRTSNGFATDGETAQWLNWGNWANWANWSNWANWANWANFLNH